MENEIENIIREIKNMSHEFEVQYWDEVWEDNNNKSYYFDVFFSKNESLRLDIDHNFLEEDLFISWEYRKEKVIQKYNIELSEIEQLFRNFFERKKFKYEFESFKD